MDALFTNLYEKFFMRDLLARIAPGMLLLFVIWRVFAHRRLLCCENLAFSILGILFILSISYFLGFAAQKLGEFLGILKSRFCFFRKTDEREDQWHKQLERRVLIDTYPVNATQSSHKILTAKKTVVCKEIISSESSTPSQEMPIAVIRQRERLIYLKDGAGAFGMALMLSGVLLLFCNFLQGGTCLIYLPHNIKTLFLFLGAQCFSLSIFINCVLTIILILIGGFILFIHHTMWEEQAEYEIEILAKMGLINQKEHCESLYKCLRHDC